MSLSEKVTRDMNIFFVTLSKRPRVLVKMNRMRVLVKTGLAFLFSYSDLIAEMFVFLSYQTDGRTGLTNASISCIDFSLRHRRSCPPNSTR